MNPAGRRKFLAHSLALCSSRLVSGPTCLRAAFSQSLSLNALSGSAIAALGVANTGMAVAQTTPTLQIAAAADLALCIDEINAGFVKANGVADAAAVKYSIGASGAFATQIQSGAPFDVFLSADTEYPRLLARAGAAEASSMTVYALGRLVLWTNDAKLDPSRGFTLLTDPAVSRIAIANPAFAPYGRAARAALINAGVWAAIQPKLVLGENLAQTAQFVETRNAQVGLVGTSYLATPAHAAKGRAWALPADQYPQLEQGAIVTRHGAANPLAMKYLTFLTSAQGRAILARYGFGLPAAAR
ncbi:MAG: molybdenum transporter, periplasmic molybdate-binding protein [Herminiimonas sp.]|nr:molybdenum transporter, periplasmic molybdate-binding protein [Herminiimonas sp.]MDB5852744.1 molybdenum transporter, periplasmic molybdate-binding protein [Herminiimonas sp.]